MKLTENTRTPGSLTNSRNDARKAPARLSPPRWQRTGASKRLSTAATGVVSLNECGPNGATVGPHDNLLLGCTPQNNPSNVDTLVINAKTKNYAHISNTTGSDEVWFNSGDNRYYTGRAAIAARPGTCPDATHPGSAVLGVIDGTSVLIEKIPQSSGLHSVAAASERNFIYVPQVAPKSVVGSGGDITAVGAGICGRNNGCVVVYEHDVDEENERDRDRDPDYGHYRDHEK